MRNACRDGPAIRTWRISTTPFTAAHYKPRQPAQLAVFRSLAAGLGSLFLFMRTGAPKPLDDNADREFCEGNAPLENFTNNVNDLNDLLNMTSIASLNTPACKLSGTHPLLNGAQSRLRWFTNPEWQAPSVELLLKRWLTLTRSCSAPGSMPTEILSGTANFCSSSWFFQRESPFIAKRCSSAWHSLSLGAAKSHSVFKAKHDAVHRMSPGVKRRPVTSGDLIRR